MQRGQRVHHFVCAHVYAARKIQTQDLCATSRCIQQLFKHFLPGAKLFLTLKEPGFLDPSHSRGGGGGGRIPPPPLRSRKPIDETSSVWY